MPQTTSLLATKSPAPPAQPGPRISLVSPSPVPQASYPTLTPVAGPAFVAIPEARAPLASIPATPIYSPGAWPVHSITSRMKSSVGAEHAPPGVTPDAAAHHHNPDTEWMLRAGIALASSTREEKGQSWLVKRQSSTSLVSDSHQIDLDSQQQQQPWASRSSARRSQSGISTPAAYSRRASRSGPTSRRSSRPDLAMTSLDITRFSSRQENPTMTSSSGLHTPIEEQSRHMLPDFVDERIRAEMANIADEEDEEEDNLSFTTTSDSLIASEDEIDEQEFQRLTRERGFGLGSWIDRMVEWTLFGVDDWPLSTTTATTAPPAVTSGGSINHDPQSLMHDNIHSQETDTISIATESDIASISEEKPGTRGGWEDAGWLFRIVKQALS